MPAADPELITVRLEADAMDALARRLAPTARGLGRDPKAVLRDALRTVFDALAAEPNGFVVDAWHEDAGGRLTRAREFSIGG